MTHTHRHRQTDMVGSRDDSASKNNVLNLLHEASKTAEISIKTPVGPTEKKTIENIILQGETFSSILCTDTINRISK